MALYYQYDQQNTTLDLVKAAYWYTQAAQQGLDAAQFNLGIFYQDGLGVAQDMTQAIYWLEQAAEQNNSDAQNNLGAIYENAKGVEKNLKLAENWYIKAAEQGDSLAQSNLGIFYFNHGQALRIKDRLQRAYAWLGCAIYSDYPQAITAKQIIFKQLSVTQLMEARKLMSKCILASKNRL